MHTHFKSGPSRFARHIYQHGEYCPNGWGRLKEALEKTIGIYYGWYFPSVGRWQIVCTYTKWDIHLARSHSWGCHANRGAKKNKINGLATSETDLNSFWDSGSNTHQHECLKSDIGSVECSKPTRSTIRRPLFSFIGTTFDHNFSGNHLAF